RARFADPTNPDRPPMPPDDPAAWDLSPHPQRPPWHAGVRLIEGFGYLDYLAACTAANRAEEAAKAGPSAARTGAVETAEPPPPGPMPKADEKAAPQPAAPAGATPAPAAPVCQPYKLKLE